jgi:hypothetical protein
MELLAAEHDSKEPDDGALKGWVTIMGHRVALILVHNLIF